jgi:uncharacterized membrane protein
VLEERQVQAAELLPAAKDQRVAIPVAMLSHLWVLVVVVLPLLAQMEIQARALAVTVLHTSATPLVVVVVVAAFHLQTVELVAVETAALEVPEPPTPRAEPLTPAAVEVAVETPDRHRLAQVVRVVQAL